MKKKLLFAAIALTAMASCTEDSFVGEQSQQGENGNGGAITFSSGFKAVTRSTEGADAANLLNKNFVVYGYKTVSSSPQVVFDNYQVNWATNTAGTSESNSADWEYVGSGIKNLPFGTTTASGGELNTSGVATNASGSSTNVDQSIKYWDFSATAYDFFAYSLGKGSSSTWAKASAMNKTGYGDGSSHPGYTLEGTADQLATCYISNKKNVTPSTSATEVDLEFRSFLSKIELQFYEIIPGYSVKSLSFYPSSSGVAAATPYLYTTDEVLPSGGKYTVTFDSDGKAQLTLAASDPAPTKTNQTTAFSTTLTNYKGAEYQEANSTIYLGRASNDATKTNTISMLPNPQNTNALNLKMDFTLVSRDGTGETINMTGAPAVIPATYATWLPNYKYTSIFKISDNTNALSGSVQGLYPITLDAVVTDAVDDGTQTTITTVATPSITTSQKGSNAATNEYKTTSTNKIYAQVMNGGTLVSDLNTEAGEPAEYTKSFFYSLSAAKTEAEVMDALNIRESETGAGVITGRNELVLTPAGINNKIEAIPGEDGHDITVTAGTAAELTAPSAGTYAYVYLVSTGSETYIYSAQELSAEPTDWNSTANIYYSNPNGTDQINEDYANPSFALTAEPADWVASSANVYYSNSTCTTVISSSFASLHEFDLTGDAPTDWNTSDNVYYSDDACTEPINAEYASLHAFALTAKPSDWNDNVWYKNTECTTPVDTYSDDTYYKKVHCYKKVNCYKKLVCYKKYTDKNNTYAVKVIKVVAE